MKIFIGNGHGQFTPGKRSPDGQLREAFYLLRHTLCPAVLSENGFMTNEQECR